MKDYRIILKTQLDVTDIQKQIDDLQKKIAKTNFTVKGGGTGAVKIVDAQAELRSLDQIYARIKELGGKNVQTTSITGKLGNTTGEIIKYRNAQNDVITETYKLEKATKTSAEGFSLVTKEVKGSVKSINTWTDGLGNAIQRTLQYATSTALLYGAMNQLRQGFQYIVDLNKEMVNIQLVTGGSSEEINSMAMEYNGLAREMGATTLQIAAGSLEFIRQGKSAEETAILIKNSTMMSKLGNMEAAESTDRLTSIMNGFKLEAEETGLVIDKLIALDNSYATSINEISTAMKYSSNSAQSVGIDLEHLAAYITVVSSTTRVGAETIGQAMKTMTARFSDIRQGFDVGEGLEVNINNIEKALREVDIPLRDDANNFRDMQDVLKDLSGVWSTLGDVQQKQIVKQFAGIRQREQFIVLMENEAEVERALTIERESAGLAAERYAIYLQGVEAAQNNLTASWEKLVMGTATAEMISGFFNASAKVLDFIDALGGIPTILKIIIPIWVLFNAELIKSNVLIGVNLVMGLKTLVPALFGATTGTGALTSAIGAANVAALPFVATLGLVALAIYGVIKANEEFEKSEQIKIDKILESRGLLKDNSKTYLEYVEAMKKASSGSGVQYTDNGEAFRAGGHGARAYLEELNLLTEAQWKVKNSTQRLDKDERDNLSTLKSLPGAIDDVTTSYQSLSDALDSLSKSSTSIESLMQSARDGLDINEAANIPPEYLSALTIQGDKLTLNIDLLKQIQIQEAETALSTIQAQEAAGNATKEQVAIVQWQYDQLISSSQRSFGAFNQTAWQYDELLWRISNDAETAGYSFMDMEGNALNSAQSIYEYLSKSDANFNDFVIKAANAMGITAQEMMSRIGASTDWIYNDTITKMANLANYVASLGLPGSSMYAYSAMMPSSSSSTPPSIFTGYGGGGSSSGSSSANNAQNEANRIEQEMQDMRERANRSLNRQLKLYKDIVDERKRLLQTMSDERKYQQETEDSQNIIVQIQNEIAELMLDNSEEAQARILLLQEQLAEAQQNLSNMEYEHSVNLQQDALDAEYLAFEKRIQEAIDAIADINTTSLSDFAAQLAAILSGIGIPAFHSGLDAGVVGGNGGGKGEMFAKLLKGEVVVNPEQMDRYMNQVLPSSMINSPQTTSNMNSGMTVDKLMTIIVNGSLDKSVLPSIEKLANDVVDKINNGMLKRGFNRRAEMFGA